MTMTMTIQAHMIVQCFVKSGSTRLTISYILTS